MCLKNFIIFHKNTVKYNINRDVMRNAYFTRFKGNHFISFNFFSVNTIAVFSNYCPAILVHRQSLILFSYENQRDNFLKF